MCVQIEAHKKVGEKIKALSGRLSTLEQTVRELSAKTTIQQKEIAALRLGSIPRSPKTLVSILQPYCSTLYGQDGNIIKCTKFGDTMVKYALLDTEDDLTGGDDTPFIHPDELEEGKVSDTELQKYVTDYLTFLKKCNFLSGFDFMIIGVLRDLAPVDTGLSLTSRYLVIDLAVTPYAVQPMHGTLLYEAVLKRAVLKAQITPDKQ